MKKLFALCLTIVMALCMAIPAFAKESETFSEQELNETPSATEITPRIGSITTRISLDPNSWTFLYQDNNWLDEYVTIKTSPSNPSGIYVRIEAKTKDGSTVVLLNKSELVPAGMSYVTPKIFNTYEKYAIFLMAERKGGQYDVTYHDW